MFIDEDSRLGIGDLSADQIIRFSHVWESADRRLWFKVLRRERGETILDPGEDAYYGPCILDNSGQAMFHRQLQFMSGEGV